MTQAKSIGKRIKRALMIASVPLLVANYAYKFDSKDIALPETRESSLMQRINPVDSLMNVPRSLLYGTWDNICQTYLDENKPHAVYKFSEGVLSTWLDSSINFLGFPLMGGYQAITGRTLEKPYMPFTEMSRR